MIKAASLIYAIFISLVIGILCYSILLIFSLNSNLEYNFDLRNRLLLNNYSGMAYVAENYIKEDFFYKTQILHKEKDIVTYSKISPWGIFNTCIITSASKRDTVKQLFFVADKHHKNSPALYVRDNDEVFKIAGKTKIEGDIYISKRGLKKVNLLGNSNLNKPKHLGKIFPSQKTMPKVSQHSLLYPSEFDIVSIEDINSSFLFNSFEKNTKVIEVTTQLESIHLKGNIIIKSNDTLNIYKSAILEDVIVQAPKVIIHSGFNGNLQVFSSKSIIVESDANLIYPSVLIVNANEDYEKKIILKESSKISGAIILYGEGLKTEKKNKLIIDKGVIITGDIYCDGTLSLYGKVNGSIYSSSFYHKTQGTSYDNLINDGQVSPKKLPEEFFQIPLMEQFENNIPLFVKKL